jgi:esterase/lipase superfamily enzyme
MYRRRDVLISFSLEDRGLAEQIARALERAGVRATLDEPASRAWGGPWYLRSDASEIVLWLVIITRPSLQSPLVQHDVRGFIDRRSAGGVLGDPPRLVPVWSGIPGGAAEAAEPWLAGLAPISADEGMDRTVGEIIARMHALDRELGHGAAPPVTAPSPPSAGAAPDDAPVVVDSSSPGPVTDRFHAEPREHAPASLPPHDPAPAARPPAAPPQAAPSPDDTADWEGTLTQRAPPSAPPPATATADARADPTERRPPKAEPGGLFRVWYGTNRRPVVQGGATVGYAAERDDELHHGGCDVRIPLTHKIGSLGSPWWKRVLLGRTGRRDDRLRLERLRPLGAERHWLEIAEQLRAAASEDRQAVVFIHGYNVSFEDAALRAAQLGFDLGVRGAMAFFSWPSQGTVDGYPADEATIEASEHHIAAYLSDFARRSGAARVNVIAHSMGNRGLLRALGAILDRAERHARVRFGHVILAAPDVDRDVFLRLARAFPEVAEHTTLYISDRDRALGLSRFLHRFARAGYAPPVTVVPAMDTVHVRNVDVTLLGHGYVAAARDVLHDMHDLLTHDAPPARRLGLREETLGDGQRYWVIGA